MSIYRSGDASLNSGDLSQAEINLYGSNRLGSARPNTDVQRIVFNTIALSGGFGNAVVSTFTRGSKLFELSDHRSNNMVTVTDRRQQVSIDNTTVSYYVADILTAQDYSSFGSLLQGRQFGSTPRYTYNGKQLDTETGWQDYGMRAYLVDVPIFGSVDPLTRSYPYYTPYSYAGNKPIKFIDVDGLEEAEPIRDAEVRPELEPLSYRMLATYARNAQSSYSGRSMFIPPSQYNNGLQTRTPAPIYEEPEEKGNGEIFTGPFITKGNEIGRAAKILTDMINPENRKQFVESVMSFVKNFETSYTHYNRANGEYETSEAMTVITWNNQEAADAFKKVYDQWKTKRDEIIKNTEPISYSAPYMDPKNKNCMMCVPTINSKDATPEMVKQRMNDNMLRQGKRIFALLGLGDSPYQMIMDNAKQSKDYIITTEKRYDVPEIRQASN